MDVRRRPVCRRLRRRRRGCSACLSPRNGVSVIDVNAAARAAAVIRVFLSTLWPFSLRSRLRHAPNDIRWPTGHSVKDSCGG